MSVVFVVVQFTCGFEHFIVSVFSHMCSLFLLFLYRSNVDSIVKREKEDDYFNELVNFGLRSLLLQF